MNKEQEFKEQLERNDQQTVWELFSISDWVWLKDFYSAHFDEIEDLVWKSRSLRKVIEDICALESSFGHKLIENNLFVYQMNLAIKNGVLKKQSFE